MDPFSIFPYEPRPMQGELVASLHRLFLAGGRAIVEAGTVLGTHVGPGGIGVACVLAGG